MKRYSGKSKIKKIKVQKNGKEKILYAEIIKNPEESISKEKQSQFIKDMGILSANNWGDFGDDFIKKHILASYLVLVLRKNNDKIVGLASISKKNLCAKTVYYYELTVVDHDLESLNLTFVMNHGLMKRLFIENILKGKTELEFILITPNMRVLGLLSHITDFIYPNPYLFDKKTKKIPKADDETWEMAKELIRQSDYPKRKIHREGCVLEDSYIDTPWLIYEPNKVPKHKDNIINEFGETYLQYSEKSGKEFVVRVKYSLFKILRGL